MCIRDRTELSKIGLEVINVNIRDITDESGYIEAIGKKAAACLLYTSDAADERSSVDLGGRRILKKKTQL